MLVEVRRVKQVAADKPPVVQVEYLNPEAIERVRPGKRAGESEILISEEWMTCLGEPEEFAKAANFLFFRSGATDGGVELSHRGDRGGDAGLREVAG